MKKIKFVVDETILRVALIACNFVFAILSVAVIALGVIYSEKLYYMRTYIGEDFLKFPIVLIVLGCLSFVASIIGCCCARSSNRKFYVTFLTCLICLLILDLCLSVVAFLNIDATKERDTKTLMIHQMRNASLRADFHQVENYLKCCGINGLKDYLTGNIYNEDKCCGLEKCIRELLLNSTDIEFRRGCSQKVTEEIRQIAVESSSFISVYTVLQIMEIISMIFLQQFAVN